MHFFITARDESATFTESIYGSAPPTLDYDLVPSMASRESDYALAPEPLTPYGMADIDDNNYSKPPAPVIEPL